MASSPAPWTIGLADAGVYIDAAGYTIAQVFGLQGADNAKLIAKAPEMAAMLRELEWSGEFDGSYACAMCSAIAPGYFVGEPRDGFGIHTEDCRLAKLLSELPRDDSTPAPLAKKP